MRPNRIRLAQRLIKDEGIRTKLYTDTTGHVSIGIGRNLAYKGARPDEVWLMFKNDLKEAEMELYKAWPWMMGLDQVRVEVMINMSFNMGIPTLSQFENTINYIQMGDYSKAAYGMRNSKWYRQVGERAERLATMMETGEAIN